MPRLRRVQAAPKHPTARLAAVSACLGVIVCAAGCHFPGGPRYSADRYTIESTTWQPQTATLIDTRTGEPVWSVDIPVGQQLVVGFSRGTGPNEARPDEIVWELMPLGKRFGTRNSRMACPPASVRRLDTTLRPTPEPIGTPVPGSPFAGEPRAVRQLGNRVVEPIDPGAPAPGQPRGADPSEPSRSGAPW